MARHRVSAEEQAARVTTERRATRTAPRRARQRRGVPTLVWLILIVVAALGGYFAERYLPLKGRVDFGQLGGVKVIKENQLDKPVANYVLDGKTYQITALEAMVQESSPDKMRNEDGTYLMPSAESVLSAARTAILMREVEKRGIKVSDDDSLAYMKKTFGTESIEELAREYNMDAATVQERLRESAAMAKLRAEVVSATAEEPAEPPTPNEGEEELRTQEFADYIIGLAGDEWDASTGAWAAYDGPYASALREYDVRSDSASYYAAQTAYNVAYQLYADQAANTNDEWTDFVNGLLCEASLALSSVVM